VLFTAALVAALAWPDPYATSAFPLVPDPNEISLIALIMDPISYDGERIRVSGFAVFEHEAEALFLSRDDALYHIQVNSIRLDTRKSLAELRELNGRYVYISGTFKATKDEMRGYIHSIDILRPLIPLRKFP
jgi:hypothetical protein